MAKSTQAPNLTQKWWSDNKAKTLKSTGFGKALNNWAKTAAKFDSKKLHSLGEFESLDQAALNMMKTRDKALKACNNKLHKETIEILKSYDKLFRLEIEKYNAMSKAYLVKLDKWMNAANEAMKAMHEQGKRAFTVEKNTQSLIKAAKAAKQANDASKIQGLKKLSQDFQSRAKDISSKAEKIFKPFSDPGKSGLVVEDAYDSKKFPKYGNVSSVIEGKLEEIEDNCTKADAILNS